MKIQILGTSAAEGWPGLFCSCEACERARASGGKNLRSRSGTVIDDQLMIDFSADAYSNSMRFGIRLSRVHSLFVTHEHEDHFCPSELHFRYGCFAYPDKKDPQILTVYGNDRVGDKLSVFTNKEKDRPQRVLFCPFRPFETVTVPNGYRVTALPALHDRAQQCVLYLVEDAAGKRMLYGHDTGFFPEPTFAALAGKHLDFAMFDCNEGGGRDGKNHMGFRDDLIVRDRLRDLGCVDGSSLLVLTHFSHNGGMLHEALEKMARPEGFSVAFDGAIYAI